MGLEKLYPATSTLRKYVVEKIDKKQRNMWKRIKRFKRKVSMNRWNYFVTFTCDPKKHTEESFRKKLRKCLSNLHTRRGWKYMGVFEYGEANGAIHFHRLIYCLPFPCDRRQSGKRLCIRILRLSSRLLLSYSRNCRTGSQCP